MDLNLLDQKMLKPFGEMLRCRICSEFFHGCVITSCSHNFCSACLKKRLETESDCPTCFEDIEEKALRSNRSMDKLVRIYKKLIKTNTAQSSELQTPKSFQKQLVPSSSVVQATSQTQNCQPVQMSTAKIVPTHSTTLGRNNQFCPRSSTPLTMSSTETVPLQSVASTGTVSVVETLPQTFPVVLLQRIENAVTPKAKKRKENEIFDDYEDIENCSFTDDSNDSGN